MAGARRIIGEAIIVEVNLVNALLQDRYHILK
jgi:hypothetical protein